MYKTELTYYSVLVANDMVSNKPTNNSMIDELAMLWISSCVRNGCWF